MKNLTKHFKAIITTIVVITVFPTPLQKAHTSDEIVAQSSIVNSNTVQISQGSIDFGLINIDNEVFGDQESPIRSVYIEVESYDPKTDNRLELPPLMGIKTNLYNIPNNDADLEIEYAISIPIDYISGSYFNRLVVTMLNGNKLETPITISQYLINVVSENQTLEKVFIEETDTTLIIEKLGIPFISNTVVKFEFKNNSNFVFKPYTVFYVENSKGENLGTALKLNEEKDFIYKDGKISITREFELWNSTATIFDNLTVVATSYGVENDDIFIINRADISIKPAILILTSIAVISIVWMASLTTSAVIKRVRNNKKEDNEKKED